MNVFTRLCLVIALPFFVAIGAEEEQTQKSPLNSSTFQGLKFRLLGPAVTSGRISDMAIHPSDRHTWYVAAASGGVWKTSNAGTTWKPVFDDLGSYSIGCITVDPNNPFVLWVGTGENNSQRSVSWGDGIYRSEDGGGSWRNMGLRKSEHIGKILVDPRDSRVVYVAAQGPLWGPGGDRGLFKTTDAGKTWTPVLTVSENTGVSDIVMDPRSPDVLYASSYQRRRHVYTIINGGPESGIHKSTDGGATWSKLTNGLPAAEMGRIGLAISPVNPDVVYATIEAAERKGGFFRSTNRGASWERMSEYVASGQYYGEIVCDPGDVDRVYAMDVYLKVTTDAGKTFRNLGEKSKHVDNHAMWIDPSDTDHYLVGCDGGLYESFDRGATWDYTPNLPITQFYRVTVDNATPFYTVYGGTQDNFTLGGPSRTTSASGIVNADWFVTVGGDGFTSRVDPSNPDIVYSQSQYGGLVRFDRRSGEQTGIKPQEGIDDTFFRWNWDSPLIISPHSPTRLYFAANKVFRSDDRGNTWTAVSPDLTRQIDRNTLPVMGRIWPADAVSKSISTSLFGNITALSESPMREGLLYAGTDDGLVQVTEDGGKTWRKIDRIRGVPDTTFVSRLEASQHVGGRVYAAFDNHKRADFTPYLFRSDDGGKSWTSISGDLPSGGPVYALAEDHVNPDLLFAGTEFGVFFTCDGGKQWIQLKGGLPVIAVRDIAIQKRENDLVLATFGRGFYVLDDYTPLRQITRDLLNRESTVFPVRQALMYNPSHPLGGSGKAYQGESFYTAENPPFGATVTYYLKDKYNTRKELRQAAEKEAIEKGKTPPYPTPDELRLEDEEEAPSITISVMDDAGVVIRRIPGANAGGINRATWDLRYAATTPARLDRTRDDDASDSPMGRPALPGTYSVTLAKRVRGVDSVITGQVTFEAVVLANTTLPAADRGALAAFQRSVAELQRATSGASRSLNEMKERIGLMKRAVGDTPGAPEKLRSDLDAMELELNELNRLLIGDRSQRSRNEGSPPAISERVDGIVEDLWSSTSAPTQTHRDALDVAARQFEPVLGRLRALKEKESTEILPALEKAGAPWTPGRVPDWRRK